MLSGKSTLYLSSIVHPDQSGGRPVTAHCGTCSFDKHAVLQANCASTHYHIKPETQINLGSYLEEDIWTYLALLRPKSQSSVNS